MTALRFPALLLAALTVLAPGCTRAQSTPPVTIQAFSKQFEALADRVSPAIVQVITSSYTPLPSRDPESPPALARQRGAGSGVIVDPSGYIITNAHVVEGARRVQVLLASRLKEPVAQHSILKAQPRMRDAEVVGIDSETDLAVLKVKEEGLPSLPLGDSEELRQGQIVFAFGSPLGLENSVTMGIVSSVARQLKPDSTMIYIQTDTAINPGNSGGPLVDAEGRVMGINTLIFSQSGGNEGIGFAAPSNIVKAIYSQIRELGAMRRGEIGVTAQTVTPLLANGLGLSRDWGVVLGDVEPGGPAHIAGLKVGDIVVSMDGKPMENARQFHVNLYQRAIGDVVKLDILRDGKARTHTVAVLEREDDPDRFARLVSRQQNLIEPIGVLAIDLNRNVEKMLPPVRQSAGAVVAARVAEGPYWSELFEPGDVIYQVNRTLTPGVKELREALDALSAGDAVVVQLERRGKMQYVVFELE